MARNAACAVWGSCLAIAACSVSPSRTPLGGSYTSPTTAPEIDRQAHAKSAVPSHEDAGSAPEALPVAALVAPSPSLAGGHTPAKAPDADTLRYEPLKTGDRIKANVSLSFSLDMQGGPPGMGPNAKLSQDMSQRVELKIIKASAQSLDELEVTLALVSMHSEFAGHGTDQKDEPAKTFDVTLSGRSPSLRARDGSKVRSEERAIVTALIVPIVEFHAHWSRSASLELKPGYAVRVPISVASLFDTGNDKIQIGPFTASYAGRDAGSDQVPFAVTLPIKYHTDAGQLDFDLSGTAKVNASQGRPTGIDLSGAIDAHGGPSGQEISMRGTTKLSATLSYP